MGRGFIKEVDPERKNYLNMMANLEMMTFSKAEAAFVVGGPRKLENMIAAGKIRANKISKAKNGSWRCNAADVMRECKDMTEYTPKRGKSAKRRNSCS